SLGIGTTFPDYRLHILQNQEFAYSAGIQNAGIAAGRSFGLAVIAGTNSLDVALRVRSQPGNDLLLVRGDGNVGIGTGAPDAKLTVNGSADKPGGGSWAVFSDERLKNIKGRFTPGLKAVMQL